MTNKIRKEFTTLNIIGVTLEHNDLRSGNDENGSFTKLTIEDSTSSCMELNGDKCKKLELVIRGDSERDKLLAALKMIIEDFEKNIFNAQEQFSYEKQKRITENAVLKKTLETYLVDCKLSKHTITALAEGEILTISDLISSNKMDLFKLRRFGKLSMEEVEILVKSKDLRFGMNVERLRASLDNPDIKY